MLNQNAASNMADNYMSIYEPLFINVGYWVLLSYEMFIEIWIIKMAN